MSVLDRLPGAVLSGVVFGLLMALLPLGERSSPGEAVVLGALFAAALLAVQVLQDRWRSRRRTAAPPVPRR